LFAVSRNEIVIINEKYQKDGNRAGRNIARGRTSTGRQIARKESHFCKGARVATATSVKDAWMLFAFAAVDAFCVRRLCQRC
jgi:hypothetical protein